MIGDFRSPVACGMLGSMGKRAKPAVSIRDRVKEFRPESERQSNRPSPLGIEYRDILEYPGYQVGSDGTVWTCWSRASPNEDGSCLGGRWIMGTVWRRLTLKSNRTGYPRAALYARGVKKHRRIMAHILVLEAFVGPRPLGLQACHNDGDKSNCRLENLRWDTPKANWADRRKHGAVAGMARGQRHPMARLTESDIRAIRVANLQGIGATAIAHQFGISISHACRIINRECWSHV